jgi:hypothetical protein
MMHMMPATRTKPPAFRVDDAVSRRLARVRSSLPRPVVPPRARADYRNVITVRENNTVVVAIFERSYGDVTKNGIKWETTLGVLGNYLITQAFVFVVFFA